MNTLVIVVINKLTDLGGHYMGKPLILRLEMVEFFKAHLIDYIPWGCEQILSGLKTQGHGWLKNTYQPLHTQLTSSIMFDISYKQYVYIYIYIQCIHIYIYTVYVYTYTVCIYIYIYCVYMLMYIFVYVLYIYIYNCYSNQFSDHVHGFHTKTQMKNQTTHTTMICIFYVCIYIYIYIPWQLLYLHISRNIYQSIFNIGSPDTKT